MQSALITHPVYLEHQTPDHHPEHASRLTAITEALDTPEFASLLRHQPKPASPDTVALAHHNGHLSKLESQLPRHTDELTWIDGDTCLSAQSLNAALAAAGGACEAVDLLFQGRAGNAFCASRPPGHHATYDSAMGFCLLNNVAIAARHAQLQHAVERVAIVDFDVHHGNGTQDIFAADASVLYASTHQQPLFPGTGSAAETGVGNLINRPLTAGSSGKEFRAAYEQDIFPAIDSFAPQLLLVSAGFDGHRLDPLANLQLEVEDYAWITQKLRDLAERHCTGRLVCVLEGGYHLPALAASVAAVVKVLQH